MIIDDFFNENKFPYKLIPIGITVRLPKNEHSKWKDIILNSIRYYPNKSFNIYELSEVPNVSEKENFVCLLPFA